MSSPSESTLTLIEFILFITNPTSSTENYTLSLHDALPIRCSTTLPSGVATTTAAATPSVASVAISTRTFPRSPTRSEEHTSELQSHVKLVCRLLLEKKKPDRLRP